MKEIHVDKGDEFAVNQCELEAALTLASYHMQSEDFNTWGPEFRKAIIGFVNKTRRLVPGDIWLCNVEKVRSIHTAKGRGAGKA